MIAFLGMGLLGSNFVRALLRRGEQVQVWNRSAEKALPLEALGARVFDEPADAVRGASRIHLTLSDDAAVDDVLARAAAGFGPRVIVVDHTTTSPAGTAVRGKRLVASGIPFQHAPVFMGPQNALDGTGIMLVSGDSALIERLRPELEQMTGKLVHCGSQLERAAAFKLLGNLFLMFITTGVGETFSLAHAFGIQPEEAAKLFEIFNPGLTLSARVSRILAANTAPASWELQMARKDARLMLEAASTAGVDLTLLPGIAASMDRFIASGHAHDDWTVIARPAR